jgi:hypothetical protein
VVEQSAVNPDASGLKVRVLPLEPFFAAQALSTFQWLASERPVDHSRIMKPVLFAALVAFSLSIHAQVGTSPRTLTRRIEPLVRPQPPRSVPPGGAPTTAAPAVQKPLTAADLEQKKMELSAEEKKKLQWQMERAEKGSDNAQAALGVRYLNGDGVEKDGKKARKWLEAAAKQGNAEAKKTLAEHPELPPYDPKADEKPAEAQPAEAKAVDPKKS